MRLSSGNFKFLAPRTTNDCQLLYDRSKGSGHIGFSLELPLQILSAQSFLEQGRIFPSRCENRRQSAFAHKGAPSRIAQAFWRHCIIWKRCCIEMSINKSSVSRIVFESWMHHACCVTCKLQSVYVTKGKGVYRLDLIQKLNRLNKMRIPSIHTCHNICRSCTKHPHVTVIGSCRQHVWTWTYASTVYNTKSHTSCHDCAAWFACTCSTFFWPPCSCCVSAPKSH